ncbi:MAG: hypothetical protein ACI835_001951 [Planctomycetota bacterium]|jgi:hypothetical protein
MILHRLAISSGLLLPLGIVASQTFEGAAGTEGTQTYKLSQTKKASSAALSHRIDPVVEKMQGWKVHIDPSLLNGDHGSEGARALSMLDNHLERISLLVTGERLTQLRSLEIWIESEHPELENMQYHPAVEWLVARGYDARLVKKVHIPRAANLLSRQQLLKHPFVVLHELAHAYHDQFLSFDDTRILAAFERAERAGNYQQVLDHRGSTVEHYALSDHKEYFAEATEAYFYRNDFYPFVAAELEQHDPGMYRLLGEIWGSLAP